AQARPTSLRGSSIVSWSPSRARGRSSTSITATCSTRSSGRRSRSCCAPGSRKTSSPTPRKCAFLGYRAALGEPQPALDDAVDDPHRVRRQHEIADQHQREHAADHAPQQPPPEGADLPAEMRLEPGAGRVVALRSEEHTSELQSRGHLVCRLLLEKKKKENRRNPDIDSSRLHLTV